MWSINCALLRIIVPNRVIPSGFLSIFVINKNIDMALQTTGLEFFYLIVGGTRVGLHCLYCIYWHVFTTKDVFAVGERIGVCFLLADCPKDVRPIMYSKWWMHYWNVAFLVKSNTKNLEFLLRKAYRAIILRRHNDGSV